MNKELTEIVLVVDRSGSMSSIREDAQGGINAFIEEQKKIEGKANFTLVEFDDKYEFLHEGVDIQKVEDYTLVPRGMTALNDAVGRAMTETGERLAKMDEADRPGLVVFVIVTDGGENSSREYTAERLREMIKEQEEVYNWQFTFLGAGKEAFDSGSNIGFKGAGTVLCDANNITAVYKCASANVGRMRGATMMNMSLDNSYTSEEIKSMTN